MSEEKAAPPPTTTIKIDVYYLSNPPITKCGFYDVKVYAGRFLLSKATTNGLLKWTKRAKVKPQNYEHYVRVGDEEFNITETSREIASNGSLYIQKHNLSDEAKAYLRSTNEIMARQTYESGVQIDVFLIREGIQLHAGFLVIASGTAISVIVKWATGSTDSAYLLDANDKKFPNNSNECLVSDVRLFVEETGSLTEAARNALHKYQQRWPCIECSLLQ